MRFSNRATSKAHVIDHCPSLVLPKAVATWPQSSSQLIEFDLWAPGKHLVLDLHPVYWPIDITDKQE